MKLESPTIFDSKIRKDLSTHLEKRLNLPTSSPVVSCLVSRYIDCFSLEMPPSQRILTDYMFNEPQNLDMAAKGCEFYGGINYKALDNRHCLFNLHDYEKTLSTVYGLLSQTFPELQVVEENTSSVLAAFRQTTDSLDKDSKILRLHH